MGKTILAIGAHFDDIEIGVGGTLLKHRDFDDKIYLAITHSDEDKSGDVRDRIIEEFRSLDIININPSNLKLFYIRDKHTDIVWNLDQLNPDIIYTMYGNDSHYAHVEASKIGQAVGRKMYSQVILYNSGSSIDFTPNVFSIIDFDKKQELLNCFQSQIQRGSVNMDFIKRRESYWASLITDKPDTYAEGFVVRKMLYNI